MKKQPVVKKLMALVLAFALCLGLALPVFAADADALTVEVDGVVVAFEGQQPVNVRGTILVPVRGVFELMGFTPQWNRSAGTATLTSDDTVVVITVGEANFTVNGETFVAEPLPAQIMNGRVMLPLNAVAEALGATTQWVGATQTAHIHTQAGDVPPAELPVDDVPPVEPPADDPAEGPPAEVDDLAEEDSDEKPAELTPPEGSLVRYSLRTDARFQALPVGYETESISDYSYHLIQVQDNYFTVVEGPWGDNALYMVDPGRWGAVLAFFHTTEPDTDLMIRVWGRAMHPSPGVIAFVDLAGEDSLLDSEINTNLDADGRFELHWHVIGEEVAHYRADDQDGWLLVIATIDTVAFLGEYRGFVIYEILVYEVDTLPEEVTPIDEAQEEPGALEGDNIIYSLRADAGIQALPVGYEISNISDYSHVNITLDNHHLTVVEGPWGDNAIYMRDPGRWGMFILWLEIPDPETDFMVRIWGRATHPEPDIYFVPNIWDADVGTLGVPVDEDGSFEVYFLIRGEDIAQYRDDDADDGWMLVMQLLDTRYFSGDDRDFVIYEILVYKV